MSFDSEWAAWHAQHEAYRTDPHGFLAITGMYWLVSTPQEIPGIPGWWSGHATGGPVVELPDGEALTVDGTQRTGRIEFGPVPERGHVTATYGEVSIEIARRGGHDIVRPRDPASPILAHYRGTPCFAPDPRWRVPATLSEFDVPRPVTVGSVAEGLFHVYEAPGELRFEIDGLAHTVTAFNGYEPGTLTVLFTDATSGVTTYPANRSLTVEITGGEQVVLDFNRATNLPCAYTSFATCPLPPAENALDIAVTAGEKWPKSAPSADDLHLPGSDASVA